MQLQQYVCDRIHPILLYISELESGFNRIHRLLKLPHLPDNVPRDVILHFYHVKEKLSKDAYLCPNTENIFCSSILL